MTRLKGIKARLAHLARSDSGAITVEAIMWLPFYLVFIALIADVSMLFHQQAKAQRIAQDLNRLWVLTYPEDEAELQLRADTIVKSIAPTATVTIVHKTDSIQTFVSMPTADLLPIGLLSVFKSFDIGASAAHLRER